MLVAEKKMAWAYVVVSPKGLERTALPRLLFCEDGCVNGQKACGIRGVSVWHLSGVDLFFPNW